MSDPFYQNLTGQIRYVRHQLACRTAFVDLPTAPENLKTHTQSRIPATTERHLGLTAFSPGPPAGSFPGLQTQSPPLPPPQGHHLPGDLGVSSLISMVLK